VFRTETGERFSEERFHRVLAALVAAIGCRRATSPEGVSGTVTRSPNSTGSGIERTAGPAVVSDVHLESDTERDGCGKWTVCGIKSWKDLERTRLAARGETGHFHAAAKIS
jgi:hypothetical protein